MSAGALRARLVLEQPVGVADGGGGVSETWSEVARLWAQVTPLSGGERFEHGRVAARIAHRIRVRFRPDVRPQMRFRLGERILDIQAAYDVDGKRQWLDCLCEERAA